MSIEQEVIIEYCNLPMQIAFQNPILAVRIKELLLAHDYSFERIRNAKTTFRQLVYLHKGDGIPLKMSDVSYMKVDVKYQDDLQFCIEKIVGGGLELYFYPYDQEEERKLTGPDIVRIQGKRLLWIKMSSRKQLLSIVKRILVDGTVELMA